MLTLPRCKISPSHIIVHQNTKRLKIMPRIGFAPATGLQPYTSRTPKPTVPVVCSWVSLFWFSLYMGEESVNFCTWRNSPIGPGLSHYRGFTITLRHTTLFRSPLDT